MPDLRAAVVNRVWRAASRGAARRLRAALRAPADAQASRLLACVRANETTAFGREHGFASIRTVAEYQARVPIRGFDELEPYFARVARGERGVLTAAPVERLVPSSGSTAAVKLLPFTATLRGEFSAAVDAWIADLLTTRPALLGGPAYWSITPAADRIPHGEAAVPVGFDDDSRYLGGTRQILARAILAVPPSVGRVRDPRAFLYATALHLLRARELRLVSVWHPSFLERVLDTIAREGDRLLDDLVHGTTGGHLQPARARELRRVRLDDPRAIWPRLSLVSCWADGPSRLAAAHLARRLDGIPIQAKGLLATEGVVTIPLDGRHPLALTSHVFEFVGPDGRARLAHELERDGEYGVVLTTGGGLFRYRLGDRVRVDGFVERTPSLAFVGRDDRVADLRGEKLSEGFVADVVASLFRDRLAPRFALLAPEDDRDGIGYTLFVSREAVSPGLDAQLEPLLRRNPHYGWCVDLGQLRPSRVIPVADTAAEAYADACVGAGQRLGDVKPAVLRPELGWSARLPIAAPATEVPSC